MISLLGRASVLATLPPFIVVGMTLAAQPWVQQELIDASKQYSLVAEDRNKQPTSCDVNAKPESIELHKQLTESGDLGDLADTLKRQDEIDSQLEIAQLASQPVASDKPPQNNSGGAGAIAEADYAPREGVDSNDPSGTDYPVAHTTEPQETNQPTFDVPAPKQSEGDDNQGASHTSDLASAQELENLRDEDLRDVDPASAEELEDLSEADPASAEDSEDLSDDDPASDEESEDVSDDAPASAEGSDEKSEDLNNDDQSAADYPSADLSDPDISQDAPNDLADNPQLEGDYGQEDLNNIDDLSVTDYPSPDMSDPNISQDVPNNLADSSRLEGDYSQDFDYPSGDLSNPDISQDAPNDLADNPQLEGDYGQEDLNNIGDPSVTDYPSLDMSDPNISQDVPNNLADSPQLEGDYGQDLGNQDTGDLSDHQSEINSTLASSEPCDA
jgi:hypothetical protein